MCLMCEFYEDSCDHPACVVAAPRHDVLRMRSGTTLYLWRGAGKPVCPEMASRHGASCACMTGPELCDCGVID